MDTHSSTWTGPFTYEIAAGARRFESWEYGLANRLGLGAAVQYALAVGIDAIAERTSGLGESLRVQLRALPGVSVLDKGLQRCGIVTFSADGVAAADVKAALSAAKVNTTTTQAVFAQFDFPERGLDHVVRASPHYFNTDAELAKLVEVVAALT